MEVEENKRLEEEKNDKRKKRYIVIILLLLLLMGVTVGYAALSTSIHINGTSHIKNVTIWDIHFENLVEKEGSVKASLKPTIDTTKTFIQYAVDLTSPGDFYEFSIDVRNSGSIDAKLQDMPKLSGVSSEQTKYVNYTVTHADDSPIVVGEVIEVGKATKFKVRIEIKKDVALKDMPTEKEVLNLSVDIPYEQA